MGFTTWNKWCWFLTSFALKMCSKPWMFVFNLNLLVFGWVLHKCTLNMQHKAFNYAKWILIPFNFLSMLKIHFSHELCFTQWEFWHCWKIIHIFLQLLMEKKQRLQSIQSSDVVETSKGINFLNFLLKEDFIDDNIFEKSPFLF